MLFMMSEEGFGWNNSPRLPHLTEPCWPSWWAASSASGYSVSGISKGNVMNDTYTIMFPGSRSKESNDMDFFWWHCRWCV
jgi:hypothetical protein